MTGEPSSEEPGGARLIADRYRLLSPLGEGGMGTVWRARDEVLHREVAVKEVRAPVGLPAEEVDRLYARLEREAWAAARISHRSVVTVYDVATEDGRPWIVMELVRGLTLSDVLDAEGPMTPRRAAQIGGEVLAALRSAHEAGVLHRDVKPGNVLVANDGRVVLTDFGIAMVEGSSALTMTGEVVGSPEFLAPERALGRRPGPESDLWSLGVLLYAAVEGVSPFRQDTPLSTLRAVVDEELPPPRRAGPLASVIEGLLRKDPADRLSAEDAARDLRIVGAGGTPGTPGTAASGSYAATVTSHQEPARTPPLPSPVPPVAPGATTATTPPPHRSRRAVVALVAGLVALALALGGLTYALMHRNDGSGKEAGNPSGSGGGQPRGATSSAPDNGGATSPSSSASGSPGGGHGGTASTPAQYVQVTLDPVRTSYTGACPPPNAQAPAFTATFTVARVPAEVRYRWVTKEGESSDPGWKTLSFAAGGGRIQQVHHVELGYKAGDTYENKLHVEVRSPVRTTSGWVAYSVTCVTETPTTGGASSSPSGAGHEPGASVPVTPRS